MIRHHKHVGTEKRAHTGYGPLALLDHGLEGSAETRVGLDDVLVLLG